MRLIIIIRSEEYSLRLHLSNLLSIIAKNWTERMDWIGMIMGQECMMQRWEDGM